MVPHALLFFALAVLILSNVVPRFAGLFRLVFFVTLAAIVVNAVIHHILNY